MFDNQTKTNYANNRCKMLIHNRYNFFFVRFVLEIKNPKDAGNVV